VNWGRCFDGELPIFIVGDNGRKLKSMSPGATPILAMAWCNYYDYGFRVARLSHFHLIVNRHYHRLPCRTWHIWTSLSGDNCVGATIRNPESGGYRFFHQQTNNDIIRNTIRSLCVICLILLLNWNWPFVCLRLGNTIFSGPIAITMVNLCRYGQIGRFWHTV
jgi:hypothetical protein